MSEKKIRVLYISSWYPGRVHTTLGNFVQKHAGAVHPHADVSVLHVSFDPGMTSAGPEIVSETQQGISTTYLYYKKTRNPLLRFYRYLQGYKKGLRIVTEKSGTPDLIHLNVMYPAGLVFAFLRCYRKIPYVITEHWAGYLLEYHEKTGFIKKLMLRGLTRRAAAIFPVSLDLQRAMQGLGMHGNYHVIPNVVDTELFVPGTAKPTAKKKILHVSSLDDAQKNASGIIRVVAELYRKRQDFELHIVSDGDSSSFSDTARQASLLDRAVFFHSTKTTAEIADMMRQSDFLVLFSNYENLPCVIIEAYACGIPVVTTDVGGISEHHGPEFGIMIPPGDEGRLLDALHTMLDNAQSYDKAGLHAYAVQHFSYEVIGRQLFEQYSKIIQRG